MNKGIMNKEKNKNRYQITEIVRKKEDKTKMVLEKYILINNTLSYYVELLFRKNNII